MQDECFEIFLVCVQRVEKGVNLGLPLSQIGFQENIIPLQFQLWFSQISIQQKNWEFTKTS
jgi:hypothetical protein